MVDASYTAALTSAFQSLYSSVSFKQLVSEWQEFDNNVMPFQKPRPDLIDEQYTGYISQLIVAGDNSLQFDYFDFFCKSALAILAESTRFPDHVSLQKLHQQSLVCCKNLQIVARMKVNETEVKKFFGQAKRYLLEYATTFDKLVREKREAEEALVREKWSRINIKIISDDEDPVPEEPQPEDEEEPFAPTTIVPRLLDKKPGFVRTRRRSMRLSDIDIPDRSGDSTTRTAHSTVRDTERMDGRPPPAQKRPRTTMGEDGMKMRVYVHADVPDPRKLVREMREKLKSRILEQREAQEPQQKSPLAQTQDFVLPEVTEPKPFILRQSQRILGLVPLLPDPDDAEGTYDSNEAEMKALCAEYRNKGVTSEKTRKRMMRVFNKWRREKAPQVKSQNIREFNTACNSVDELLNESILVPNRIRKVERQFRCARKYIDVL